MITASFRHLSGIGPMRERQLWQQGVHGWDSLPAGPLVSPRLDDVLREGAEISKGWLAADALDEFARRLPETEHWRLLPQLLATSARDPMSPFAALGGVAFLDIETAPVGLGVTRGDPGEVTVIGVLDAQGPHCFLQGRDLEDFPARTRDWRCVVTFNGASFDLPILRRHFPSWEGPVAHIDLRHLCPRVGLKGGLKQVERMLGFIRPPELQGLSGEDAIWLWQAQRRGDRRALERLVAYNLSDVLHLKPLLELTYNRLLARTGMPAPRIAESARGELLYDLSKAVERALAPRV